MNPESQILNIKYIPISYYSFSYYSSVYRKNQATLITHEFPFLLPLRRKRVAIRSEHIAHGTRGIITTPCRRHTARHDARPSRRSTACERHEETTGIADPRLYAVIPVYIYARMVYARVYTGGQAAVNLARRIREILPACERCIGNVLDHIESRVFYSLHLSRPLSLPFHLPLRFSIFPIRAYMEIERDSMGGDSTGPKSERAREGDPEYQPNS